jgi:hypothetical protein
MMAPTVASIPASSRSTTSTLAPSVASLVAVALPI